MVNMKMNEMRGHFSEAAKKTIQERFYHLSNNPVAPTPASFCTLHSKLCTHTFLSIPQ